MFAFFPLETLGKPLEKLLQWMDDHRLFLVLPALGIVLSLGVLCYAHFRTPPQPEPFTLEAKRGDYCYLDVQYLSDWLLKISGGEEYYNCFYLAIGTDETMCIVSMHDGIHENFADIAEYSNSDSAAPGTMPQPYRAAGILKQMTSEDMESLIDVLDTTEEQDRALFGSNYLDLREDPNGNLVELFVYVLGASLIILLLYCVALLDEQHERRKRGKTAEAEL